MLVGVMEDENELRWFYQNQPEVLERLGVDHPYEEIEEETAEKKRSPLMVYLAIAIWGLLLVAVFW